MVRFQKKTNPLLLSGLLGASALLFFVDCETPLGLAVWIFYLAPVVLTLFASRPRVPLLMAALCSVLTVVGYFTSPVSPGFSMFMGRINRVFGVGILWIVAALVRRFVVSKVVLEEQDWLRVGQRDLGKSLQGEHSLAELGERVLGFLCEHLEAPVGALYAIGDDRVIRRVASHATAGMKDVPEVVEPGEGIVGQVIKDGRVRIVGDLPEDFLPIRSALVQGKARHVAVYPTTADGAVNGAVELGFLHPVGQSDQDLLASVTEAIGLALRTSHYRSRLEALLAQTQRQAESLQTQQEELRVTNEELEEQSRALRESQGRLEQQQGELEQTNAHLEEQTRALQEQRDSLTRAQVELVRRAEELDQANRYKSEFLANMTHELRTPLNSALILAKLLADNKDGNLTKEQVKYALTIQGAGNDLLTLINDILDLSRIESGRFEMQPGSVELKRLIRTLEQTFEPIARQKKLAFDPVLDPSAPTTIHTDPIRLEQVLRNLLSNAFKFTETGRVTLRVFAEGNDRIAFAVTDTGIGISEDKHEIIFEAFRQADGSTHRKYGGTGLGLSISRELARRLGGEIRLKSQPGEGSTFTLVLPRTYVPQEEPPPEPKIASARTSAPSFPPPAPRASAPTAEPSAKRVVRSVPDDRDNLRPGVRSLLVIEDDERFAQIVSDIAHEQHFAVLLASTAADGLELANKYTPSAVVLDMNLPDNSGLTVLEQLKRMPATRHIPVHVVSVSDYTQQALALGAVGYALKPVQRDELSRALEKLENRMDQKIRKVLVIEDVEAQRESMVRLLSGEDVQITAVSSAAEGLEKLRASTFDCVVLDLSLPDMSGYEMLDRMSHDHRYAFPPVIVYTGRSLSHDEERKLSQYATSIVIKGARSPERLLDEVSLFLHRIEANLPTEKQRALVEARNREAVFDGRKILVVEDDVRNVFAVSSVLEPKGAKVEIARNGIEALAALDRARPDGIDLVLMDLMMPEMDGLTAMREIRKRPEWKKLPIIALTAKAMPDDREHCLEAGANDYISKPLDVEKLLSLIRVWLPQ